MIILLIYVSFVMIKTKSHSISVNKIGEIHQVTFIFGCVFYFKIKNMPNKYIGRLTRKNRGTTPIIVLNIDKYFPNYNLFIELM